MKLISHSMHWFWKLTFIPAVFWIPVILAENWRHRSGIDTLHGWDGTVMLLALGPIALWIAVRWLTIKE